MNEELKSITERVIEYIKEYSPETLTVQGMVGTVGRMIVGEPEESPKET